MMKLYHYIHVKSINDTKRKRWKKFSEESLNDVIEKISFLHSCEMNVYTQRKHRKKIDCILVTDTRSTGSVP